MVWDPDTGLGGAGDRFPSTRRSLLSEARNGAGPIRRDALEEILTIYWKPAYKHIRLKWNRDNEQAKDLTQGFFTSALERGLLERFQPDRASFRSYLKMCIDGYVANEAQSEQRLKRGGGVSVVPLDFDQAEREITIATSDASLEDVFHREWQRQMFILGIEELRRVCAEQGRDVQWRIFEQYDLASGDRPTYEALSRQFQLPATTITNHLAWARRELRRMVIERLARVTGGETETRGEASQLFG